MYNYDFKDKWEGKKEAGGMPKKYTHYDENGHRIDERVTNERYTSQFDSDPVDSAFDSKYNNVDKDWIDVKSNNYFSNEEFQENSGQPKAKKGKREPWREVYAGSDKLAAPAPGNTNAFSYSNDGHII